jgi:hypothetical protein
MFMTNRIRLSGTFASPVVLVAVTALAITGAAQAQTKSWHHRDLTAETGAPWQGTVFQLAGFHVGDTDDPRLYYTDDDGHVHELAYYQRGWHHRDLTVTTGNTFLCANAGIAGFRVGGADSRVYCRGTDDHVHELAWYQGGWHHRDITASSGAPETRDTGFIAAFHVAGTDPRVYYQQDDHVHELAYYQGGWHYRDITADTGAPSVRGVEWTAFPVGGTDSRVYYPADDQHVHELAYGRGGWHHRDITADTGAPLADFNHGFAGFAVGPGRTDSRVYYGDTANHVHELSHGAGGWNHRDITESTGEPAGSCCSDALAGVAVGSTDSRVYTSGNDHRVHELAYYQGGWHHRDFTAEDGAPEWSSEALAAFEVGSTDDPRVYYTNREGVHELAYYQDGGGEEPTTRTVTLERQDIVQGFIPYLGRFPAFGVVPSGRLLQIRIPQVGPVDLSFKFVKAGRSTTECNDAGAVVEVAEGQSTTPDQINAIFGASEPGFSTQNPLVFTACVGSDAGEAPNFRNVEINVRFN